MKALVSHRNQGRDGLFIELRFGSNRGMNSHWQGSRTTYTKSFIYVSLKGRFGQSWTHSLFRIVISA